MSYIYIYPHAQAYKVDLGEIVLQRTITIHNDINPLNPRNSPALPRAAQVLSLSSECRLGMK